MCANVCQVEYFHYFFLNDLLLKMCGKSVSGWILSRFDPLDADNYYYHVLFFE
jgi:hypothetical protein